MPNPIAPAPALVAGAPADPVLAALVPPPSRGRALVAVVLAVVLLVGAWYSPHVLRPALMVPWTGWSGGSELVAGDDTFAAFAEVQPQAWPWATAEGIDPVPGTELVGAWLVPAPAPAAIRAMTTDPSPEPSRDWREAVAALVAPLDPDVVGPGSALPADFRSGETVRLVAAWRITDCAALDPDARPHVRIRTVAGSLQSHELPRTLVPGADVSAAELRTSGVCD